MVVSVSGGHALQVVRGRVMTPTRSRKIVKAFRLDRSLIEWLGATAQSRGCTLTAVVEELLEDARKTYDLPTPVVQLLEADAARLGFDHRRYAQHVFFRRYEELQERAPSDAARDDAGQPTCERASQPLALASGPDLLCKDVEARAAGQAA